MKEELVCNLDEKLKSINTSYKELEDIFSNCDIATFYDNLVTLLFDIDSIKLYIKEKVLLAKLVLSILIKRGESLDYKDLDYMFTSFSCIGNLIFELSNKMYKDDTLLCDLLSHELNNKYKLLFIILSISNMFDLGEGMFVLYEYNSELYSLMSKEEFLTIFPIVLENVLDTYLYTESKDEKIIDYIIEYTNNYDNPLLDMLCMKLLYIIGKYNKVDKLNNNKLFIILDKLFSPYKIYYNKNLLRKTLTYIDEDIIYNFLLNKNYSQEVCNIYFVERLSIEKGKQFAPYVLTSIRIDPNTYGYLLPGFNKELLKKENIDDYEQFLKIYVNKNGVKDIKFFLNMTSSVLSIEFIDFLFSKGYKINPNNACGAMHTKKALNLYIDKYLRQEDIKGIFECIDNELVNLHNAPDENNDDFLFNLVEIGYVAHKNSPYNIRNNNKYYMYYGLKHGKTKLNKLLKNNNVTLKKEYLDLLFSDNVERYQRSKYYLHTPSFEILSNTVALELYVRKTKDTSVFEDVKSETFSDRFIRYLFSEEIDYLITSDSPIALMRNPLSFILALENGQHIHYILPFAVNLNKELLTLLFSSKYSYKITRYSPKNILNSELALTMALENGQDISIVDYSSSSYFSDRFIKLLFNKYDYKIGDCSPSAILNNPLAFILYLDKHKNANDFNIDFINKSKIDSCDKLIELVFSKNFNYKITEQSPKFILSSEISFSLALENGQDPSIINYALFFEFSDEFIREIFSDKYDYKITKESPKRLRSSIYAIELYFDKYKDKGIDSSIIDVARCEIPEYIVDYLLDKGFKIDINVKKYILNYNTVMEKYFNRIVDKFNNIFRINTLLLDLNMNYGYVNLLLETLYNEDFFEYTKIDRQADIVKYILLNKSLKNIFIELVNNGELKNIEKLYDLLYPSRWDVETYGTILSNYYNNVELYHGVIENIDNLTIEQKVSLNKLLINDYKFEKFTCLESFNNRMYESNKFVIERTISSGDFKDIIFKSLCNMTLAEVINFLNYVINLEKIDNLMASIQNPTLKDLLKEYRYFIEVLTKIYDISDFYVLKELATKLNEKIYLNSDSRSISILWNYFKNIEKDIKMIYGEEINEKLTNFQELLSSEPINDEYLVIRKDSPNAYKIKKDFEYDGELFKAGSSVDCIMLNGIPFVSLSHSMNLFGSGGKISYFKNPKVIGKTHICLCAFDDVICKSPVHSDDYYIDNVVVLFDNLPSNKFVAASNRDINSQTDNNDLKVRIDEMNLNPIRDNIYKTYIELNGYNEYVYYRDGLVPSGILVTNDSPNEAEIQAALYLNVPLVQICQNQYPILSNDKVIKREEELKEYYRKLYIDRKRKNNIKELKDIKKALDDIINEYFKDDIKIKMLGVN